MNVSERVARVDDLISQTNSQIDRLSGLSLPSVSAARPAAAANSSCLFSQKAASSDHSNPMMPN